MCCGIGHYRPLVSAVDRVKQNGKTEHTHRLRRMPVYIYTSQLKVSPKTRKLKYLIRFVIPVVFNKLIRVECMSWSNTTLFYSMVEVYLHLLTKVQLHVSALDNSHLQVVHESLESSYTRFNMGSPTSPLYTAHIKSCITTF